MFLSRELTSHRGETGTGPSPRCCGRHLRWHQKEIMVTLNAETGDPMERLHLKRRLTAVLLADVVGYSRLMNVDEEGTHVRLADCVKTLIEPTVAYHEGRLVRSKGDGLLVEFDSAVNAVSCAVDIQRGLAAR